MDEEQIPDPEIDVLTFAGEMIEDLPEAVGQLSERWGVSISQNDGTAWDFTEDIERIIEWYVDKYVENKVECPRFGCAYSFVGSSRALDLIAHYKGEHDG